jgi:hypothetical protein
MANSRFRVRVATEVGSQHCCFLPADTKDLADVLNIHQAPGHHEQMPAMAAVGR